MLARPIAAFPNTYTYLSSVQRIRKTRTHLVVSIQRLAIHRPKREGMSGFENLRAISGTYTVTFKATALYSRSITIRLTRGGGGFGNSHAD